MKWYLAGPMTGIPQFNIPAFDEAADKLRSFDYEIISPAERDTYETRAAALASPDGDHDGGLATAETYGDMLARDMKIIADEIDGIILLPGWEASRGACIEAYIGLQFDRIFAQYVNGSFKPLLRDKVQAAIIARITEL